MSVMKTLTFNPVSFDSQTVSIGVFDGLHRGHLEILGRLVKSSNPAVITFNPHPRKDTRLIMRFSERLRMFKKIGIERVYVISGSDRILDWSAAEFVKNVLKTLHVEKIILGSDFRLGHNRDTSVLGFRELCSKKGISVDIVDTVMDENHKLSSTDIRKAIMFDDFGHVRELMGSNFYVSGIVGRGSGMAADLGFKTMNIMPFSGQVMPGCGVYKTRVLVAGGVLLDAVTYVGSSPTLKDSDTVIIETHIPDFNERMYGQKIKIYFRQKLRSEQKFSSKKELIDAITRDVANLAY